MSSPRRFPPPWSVEETDACFIVKDHAGQALAYVYFEEEPDGARRHICSPATRPGASPPMSRSCRTCSSRRPNDTRLAREAVGIGRRSDEASTHEV
jgi:hypothetical protein